MLTSQSKRRRIKLPKSDMRVRRSSSLTAKVEIRKDLRKKLGMPDPKILDVYCGEGTMHREAWDSTRNYLGLDIQYYKDERETVVCDSGRFLRQKDLDEFDIFDIDAFGSPIIPAYKTICNRIAWTQRSVVGFVMTDGTGLAGKWNNMSKELFDYIGVDPHLKTRFQHDERDTIIFMALRKGAALAGGKIKHLRVIGKETRKISGCPMRYISFLLERANERLQ